VRRTASESLSLIIFATGVALLVNVFSPAGIPVTRALPLTDLDPRYITPEDAKSRFDRGRTIFVDARKPDEFARGHIEGALGFDVTAFPARLSALAPLLPREASIVVYCGGTDCGQSRDLANRLEAVGYRRENIRIFRGGWKVWKANRWPSEP
jgi:rhodanese-related sulfurtransferase